VLPCAPEDRPQRVARGAVRGFAITLASDVAALRSTEEELARDWTLSPEDKLVVLHCRGEAHRLSFALQLCALRTYG